jgi:hypothetical protein
MPKVKLQKLVLASRYRLPMRDTDRRPYAPMSNFDRDHARSGRAISSLFWWVVG